MYGYGCTGYYGYSSSAAMEIVRPDADVIANWETTGGSHYAQINEIITQPTVSGTGSYNYAYWPNDNDVDRYSMSAPSANFYSVSSIKLWALMNDDAESEGGKDVECRVNIKVGGSWQTEQIISKDGSGNWSWENLTWNGSWTKNDVSNIEVSVQSEVAMSKGQEIDIATLYCEIHGIIQSVTFFDIC